MWCVSVGSKTCLKSPRHGPHWTLDFNHRDRIPGLLQHSSQLQLVLGSAAARQSSAVGVGVSQLQRDDQLQLVLGARLQH